MPKLKAKKPAEHHASELGIDIFNGDDGIFQWFLLCYLFGKPIQASVAIQTWRLLIDHGLDTPWSVIESRNPSLIHLLYEGKYTRYAESTNRGMKKCMQQLIDFYDGSLMLMIESSETADEFSKRLQKLHGIGPKVTEIFMTEVSEIFARRVE